MSEVVKCKRKACNSFEAICEHSQSREMYCVSCAKKINAHNPGLVDIPLTDVEYLRDLADRIDKIPVMYGTDEGDVSRLREISEKLR